MNSYYFSEGITLYKIARPKHVLAMLASEGIVSFIQAALIDITNIGGELSSTSFRLNVRALGPGGFLAIE